MQQTLLPKNLKVQMINQIVDWLLGIFGVGVITYIVTLNYRNTKLSKSLLIEELKNKDAKLKKQIDDTPLESLVDKSNEELRKYRESEEK